MIIIYIFFKILKFCICGYFIQKPQTDVAVKTIMKKNIPKTQSLLKKEIDILRVDINTYLLIINNNN